jgi:hypothetical protein
MLQGEAERMRHEFSDGEVVITVITYDTLEDCLAECVTSDPECTAETIRKHHKCWGFARTHEDEIHAWIGDAPFSDVLFLLGHEYGHFEDSDLCCDEDELEDLCNSYGQVAVRGIRVCAGLGGVAG